MPRPKSDEIKLNLDSDTLERLDKLVPIVASSAAAREFGVEVDRRLVSRVALLRGLTAMEAAVPQESAPAPPETPVMDVAPPPPLSIPVPEPENEPESESEEVSMDVESAEVGDDGLIRPPEGWNLWSSRERIPPEHVDVDNHYQKGGWNRYWGRSGEEVIAFYWTPEPEKQDYPSYKKTDANGKEIIVQKTPYGPGHMIPHGWSA
tara:strand:+ start:694 stop:1311 length:618 start_codon:yes stop_codon:yes gene_type:complete